jgi:hypothetical protein
VSWPFRILYALIGLSLLVQPRMFDGAWYVIGTGAVLAIFAIGRELARGRASRVRAAG